MNEPRPIQFHLSTCFVMMVMAGVTLVPAFLYGHVGHVYVSVFAILVTAIVSEEWIASGSKQTHV